MDASARVLASLVARASRISTLHIFIHKNAFGTAQRWRLRGANSTHSTCVRFIGRRRHE